MFKIDLLRARAACVALAISNVASPADLHLPREERASAWFAPTLVTNNRPMCAAALQAEQDTFFNPFDENPRIPGFTDLLTPDASTNDPAVVVLEKYPLELTLTLPDRSRAFVHFFGYPGCQGACETGVVVIDDERIVEDRTNGRWHESLEWPRALPATHRYGPDRWRLFKASDGDFYVRGTLDYHTRWYRIAAADRFELACDIALKPDTAQGKAAVYSQEVADAIEAVHVAAGRMFAGAGNCDTTGAPGQWAQSREVALETALYRPWAVVERYPGYESENSLGNYARTVVQLELWSLGGVMEHRDFAAYEAQFARTLAIVEKFHRVKFGWPQARAREMAEAALQGSISRSFGFYGYEPYPGPGEQELRRAILSRAPLEQIRELAVNPKAIDREGADSVLNVAIEYPEALSYLLDKGFDPNIGNAFGKTPLMYAAQYNQVAAAEMLLKAGADPNAPTHLPEDDCNYRITTSSLTPLHYAVRYSSARLIQLLLDHGAVTFIQATGPDGAEAPLDRLQKHSNPNIAASELTALAQLLVAPPQTQRLKLASELVARARSEYARGDAQQAYRHLRLALAAQPDQPDAIADLPLIALRAGYIGPAISAADRAIDTLTNPGARAASWFNKGLICEHSQAMAAFTADDASCDDDVLNPFVQSWKLEPLPARGNKLRAVIQQGAASCAAPDAKRHYRIAPHDHNRSFRIYVLHRPEDQLDRSRIRWPKQPEAAGAKVVDSFRLADEVVTVLDVPAQGTQADPYKPTLSIEGQECVFQL